jgi:hypothetical protein
LTTPAVGCCKSPRTGQQKGSTHFFDLLGPERSKDIAFVASDM